MNHTSMAPGNAHLFAASALHQGGPTARDLTRRIVGVDVSVASLEDALAMICGAVETRKAGIWGFCNAHTVNMGNRFPAFRATLKQITLFNDGVGLDIASRLLYGEAFPVNLIGTDFVPRVLKRLPAATPIFLLGSSPGVAAKAAAEIELKYPNIRVGGVQHGFFAAEEETAIIERIAKSEARLVLVAMGHPIQEMWCARACRQLDIPLLCVGGFLDFVAGRVPRAPRLVRRVRLEWVYRLLCEPRRLAGRYLLGNFVFLGSVLVQRTGWR